MIFELHPPEEAGPLLIGATGSHAFEVLRELGDPRILCRTPGSRPTWAVKRQSGLFIGFFVDERDRVETILLGRPDSSEDTVSYDGINIFALSAAELLDTLRARTTLVEVEEEDGSSFLAPDLHLKLWRPPEPVWPDDIDNRFIMSVRLTKRLDAYKTKPFV
jgi:hypothetical protein